MKINQAAELAGITSKNIRFYEDQGLIDPGRDPQNGYREYSMDDVRRLEQIKLMRRLGVSCENIRKMKEGGLTLERCMREHLRELEKNGESIEHMKIICGELSRESGDYSSMDASSYLARMKELENGGVQFMDIKMSDVKKRKSGAIIAAAAVVIFMALMIALVIWADTVDPAPKGILVFTIVLFGSIIVGVLIALNQRLRELEGGELDAADKY
ncbi:MAG: MerR family transcriptional regulator [Firmicutes bacterium]|nr:MerR family transcriptional regulator [Eubacterium sp.]MBR2560450.1 MerR family transcriptional regulator [Bacillota bacterium]MBR3053837.1 MerR family transcriptional regulator [Bacillota bacterium]